MTWGKHKSIPRGTTRAVRWLQEQPDVRRLILGEYLAKQKARAALNVVGPCRGGIHLLARGDTCALSLFVHTGSPNELASRIQRRFA